MTHDPLCYRSHDQPLGRDPYCQCAALRACEERVLDAARNALAALRGCIGTDGNGDGTVWIEKFDALSAIYALRKGSDE